jgi:hypothetical protein
MLPVTYENHCRACHPLQFDERLPDRQIQHGLSAREVVEELRRIYTAEVIKADPVLLRRFVPPRPMPGQAVPGNVVQAGEAVANRVLTAVRLLFASGVDEAVRKRENLPMGRRGCVECHELKSPAPRLIHAGDAMSLEVQPVVVRSLWFESADFNHAAHRALKCEECHQGVPEAKDHQRLLLPGIAQCVKCHAPVGIHDGQPRGGAGVACVECHRYHNGDHPRQGVGALNRRGVTELSVEQFLGGGAISGAR